MKKMLSVTVFLLCSCTSPDSNLGGGFNKPSTHLSTELSSVHSHGVPLTSSSAPLTSSSAPLPSASSSSSVASECFICVGKQPELISDCGCGGYYSETKSKCLSECACTCEVVDAGFFVGGGGNCGSHK